MFVPPNDPRSDRSKNAKGVIPSLRSRQPRRFPATRLDDAIVRMFWTDVDPDEDILVALKQLARDIAYVGHSSSLTRCRFILIDRDAQGLAGASMPQRRVYAGRLAASSPRFRRRAETMGRRARCFTAQNQQKLIFCFR